MTRTSRKRVILSDDNYHTLARVGTYLRRRRLEIRVARRGAEVIRMARRAHPDAVLLAYSLPDLKGDAVCRALRPTPRSRRPRILIVGPTHPRSIAARCRRAGCDAYLGASAGPGLILRRLAEHLGLPTRRHPRVATAIAVSSGDLISEFLGYARDIGLGGMLLEGARKIDAGRRLRLRLFLDNREAPLLTCATVLRSRPAAEADQRLLALRFSGMDRPSSARLRSYVAARLGR